MPEPTPGLTDDQHLEATQNAHERYRYTLVLRAAQTLRGLFPKSSLAITEQPGGSCRVVVDFGNRDRKNYSFVTSNRGNADSFLAGVIVMNTDSLEVPAP